MVNNWGNQRQGGENVIERRYTKWRRERVM
jgi:hypothetical protein